MSSRVVTLAVFVAFTVACIVQNAVAMSAELRIYKEPEFKRLRQIIPFSAGNLCYDMPCSFLSDITSSARWSGIPVAGSAFADGQVKIAFYADNNCTGRAVVVNASVGQICDFAAFGMDKATSSFAVLETSTVMEHKTNNVCD
ncbi:hypothetical protein PF005_g31285 [Phytophthora fragariae]|uniref:Uncharacterized protein n=2 Tax=Phytophthora TaxID=4783 RepID=A0A6A3PRH1_9STRA|nr:hypothetical protein PF003_g9316 [Phytophthora fragariae]KAE8965744.1 hypothetical protein PR002_g28590 [Phytophthora rubi]KAE8918286.1 hypothetical protein PF009_g31397 [Phytophthora fragariae]KAE8963811.1 hypothetical protein PF011_g28898 [Phytophthora fragariae]KAE9041974.1 hypothetical protein PR001_g6406 [Phytophthora rubi]